MTKLEALKSKRPGLNPAVSSSVTEQRDCIHHAVCPFSQNVGGNSTSLMGLSLGLKGIIQVRSLAQYLVCVST